MGKAGCGSAVIHSRKLSWMPSVLARNDSTCRWRGARAGKRGALYAAVRSHLLCLQAGRPAAGHNRFLAWRPPEPYPPPPSLLQQLLTSVRYPSPRCAFCSSTQQPSAAAAAMWPRAMTSWPCPMDTPNVRIFLLQWGKGGTPGEGSVPTQGCYAPAAALAPPC